MIWIGVDAHKRIHQAVAIDERGVQGQRRIANTAAPWAELFWWAQRWQERIWAVEGPGTSGAVWRSISPAAASACTR